MSLYSRGCLLLREHALFQNQINLGGALVTCPFQGSIACDEKGIMKGKFMKTLKERFLEKFTVDKNGCWNWQGSKNEKGYGIFWNGKRVLAHRMAWKLFKNVDIPSHIYVCHDCPNGDNRACVNPDHTFLGSHLDNQYDLHKKRNWDTKLRADREEEARREQDYVYKPSFSRWNEI